MLEEGLNLAEEVKNQCTPLTSNAGKIRDRHAGCRKGVQVLRQERRGQTCIMRCCVVMSKYVRLLGVGVMLVATGAEEKKQPKHIGGLCKVRGTMTLQCLPISAVNIGTLAKAG